MGCCPEENLVEEKVYWEEVCVCIQDISRSRIQCSGNKFGCTALDWDQFLGDGDRAKVFFAFGEEVNASVPDVCCVDKGRDCDSVVKLSDTAGRHAS